MPIKKFMAWILQIVSVVRSFLVKFLKAWTHYLTEGKTPALVLLYPSFPQTLLDSTILSKCKADTIYPCWHTFCSDRRSFFLLFLKIKPTADLWVSLLPAELRHPL